MGTEWDGEILGGASRVPARYTFLTIWPRWNIIYGSHEFKSFLLALYYLVYISKLTTFESDNNKIKIFTFTYFVNERQGNVWWNDTTIFYHPQYHIIFMPFLNGNIYILLIASISGLKWSKSPLRANNGVFWPSELIGPHLLSTVKGNSS